MFSKSTCTNESHSLQLSQEGRKSKYCMELHTTPKLCKLQTLLPLNHSHTFNACEGVFKGGCWKRNSNVHLASKLWHMYLWYHLVKMSILWNLHFHRFNNQLHKDPFCETLAPKSLISTFQGFNKTPRLSLALRKYEKKLHGILRFSVAITHSSCWKKKSHFLQIGYSIWVHIYDLWTIIRSIALFQNSITSWNHNIFSWNLSICFYKLYI
jgi:hypothetical protein